MTKQDIFIAYGDNVVMEDSGVDGLRTLAHKNDAGEIKAVQSRNCLRSLLGLPGGKTRRRTLCALRAAAEDEDFYSNAAMIGAEAHMVCRALIGKSISGGQRVVVGETVCAGKDVTQDSSGGGRFERTVELGNEIGRREMDAGIRRVAAW